MHNFQENFITTVYAIFFFGGGGGGEVGGANRLLIRVWLAFLPASRLTVIEPRRQTKSMVSVHGQWFLFSGQLENRKLVLS